MNNIEIYVLIVIYNKKCLDSVTCLCLKNIDNINIILVDNSTQDYQNKFFALKNEWIYISMNGNMGLSKAYNKGISVIKDHPNAIVCLFDDDTQVDQNYFEALKAKLLITPKSKIFLPYVYDETGLRSPCIIENFVAKKADNITMINSQNITAINSGMAIKMDVFTNYQYDENLFLDYIDHAFIRDMKFLKYKISIFDAILTHEMFFTSNTADITDIINRIKRFKKDFKRFCGKSFLGRRAYWTEMYKLKKHLFISYGQNIKIMFA
jgi:GT2 family glycosyltransferase